MDEYVLLLQKATMVSVLLLCTHSLVAYLKVVINSFFCFWWTSSGRPEGGSADSSLPPPLLPLWFQLPLQPATLLWDTGWRHWGTRDTAHTGAAWLLAVSIITGAMQSACIFCNGCQSVFCFCSFIYCLPAPVSSHPPVFSHSGNISLR